MCVNYKDLNKASPKENFPLPHIDMLMDNTAQHAFCSFMDGFSGYNQIRMVVEDREKTTFITTWGTFFYKVMPFGLKNAEATYQRAMVTLFHDMMHKEVKVYVDDMIAKSRTPDQLVEDLRKLFERLQKYKLGLNPTKCTFEVKTGNLLGFIVNERGIKVDSDKVKAIRNMTPPKMETEVRGFLRRVNYIARSISQLTATCSPIFKLFQKNQKIEWNEECQEAFEKNQRAAFWGNKMPQERKNRSYTISIRHSQTSRYPTLERTCYALVWTVKRLTQYMLAHTTWLIAKMDPLKYIFEKLALTGRIA
ncbi:Retrovirus-related Pol polyprotein from transposon 17.6, partial [Mucuna pruriens]